MSAQHRQWVAEQASQPPVINALHENGFWLNDTTRHYTRTLDEAFKTPAWRNPVQGPYRRAPSGWRPLLACVALVLLLVAGPLLWRLLPMLAGGAA